ncbi:hypothetical protein F7725_002220 [Dissostichus mawsoni]|uniref:SPRY domain-containing protein n=1 Tax=Dissostichus mawsoni TaxID=36200 RepID=A0A7J5Y2Y2_DISMA|nr:hypothetical protein F7725_002220 [Dissostichus mawsoni]
MSVISRRYTPVWVRCEETAVSIGPTCEGTESHFFTSKLRTRGPTSVSFREGSGVSFRTLNFSRNSCICCRKHRGSDTLRKVSAMPSARVCSSTAALSLVISGSVSRQVRMSALCQLSTPRSSSSYASFSCSYASSKEQNLEARMAALFTCCLGCCGDGGSGHIPLKEMPIVQLDTHHMGTDVVIVKSGRRICGTGGCLANAPLHQNKSYFEFKIQSTDTNSLVLRHDGSVYHNNEEKNRLPANSLPQEGDIVGFTYDHVEMNIYLNGKNMHCPASGIRGTVYPVVYVDDSAILDCQFSDFYHPAPQGFEKILFEQQIF